MGDDNRVYNKNDQHADDDDDVADPPIIKAVFNGDPVRVQELLSKEGSANVNGLVGIYYGNTLLFKAVEEGFLDVAKLLIQHGADPNIRSAYGGTILQCAFEKGQSLEMVKLLLENGAKGVDQYGTTPLHLASRFGHDPMIIPWLINENGADVHAKNDGGETSLHEACSSSSYATNNNNFEVAKLLVQNGADATAQDKDGNTPLHKACLYCNLETIQLLTENGADANGQNKLRQKVVRRMSCEEPNPREDDQCTPFHWACWRGDLEIVKFLYENAHANLHIKDEGGKTPLHKACFRGHLKVAKFLIKHGADLDDEDNKGETPLDVARRCGHSAIVKLSWTPMNWACYWLFCCLCD